MLDRGDKIMVINPLSDIEFEDGYIPGSVNIPLHLIPSTNLLPQDKSTPVVTYCLGPE
jgi:rhodanese-related sulfurtransferase